MRKLNNFEERIKYAAIKIAEANSNFHSEDIQIVFDLFNKKLQMAFKYSPKHKLTADIHIIKASEAHAMTKNLTYLYDLENVSINIFALYLQSFCFTLQKNPGAFPKK